jgi:hypothetical protein
VTLVISLSFTVYKFPEESIVISKGAFPVDAKTVEMPDGVIFVIESESKFATKTFPLESITILPGEA